MNGLNVLSRSFYTQDQGLRRKNFQRHVGKGPRRYKRSDESIKEEVCEILYWHPDVDASDIEVHVKEGCVYLRGNVDSRHAKKMSERIIEDVSGVEDVQNRLSLKHTLDIYSDKTITRGEDGLFSQESLQR
jgi:osmotically-inducible protein OsmY